MKATKFDKFIILLFFLGTLLSFNVKSYFGDSGTTAFVYKNGELVYTIDLNSYKEYTLEVPDGAVKIAVIDGKLYMRESPCPLKICMMSSPIFRAGDSIICVPNRIVIKVKGEASEELDSITR